MKREFLLNIGFLIVVNLLIKPFYIFGIDRTVQNTVEAREYGLYFTLFNFTFLFQIINDFGLQNFNNRHLSQHRQLLAKYFPSFLMLKFLLAILYLLVLYVAANLADYPDEYFHMLWLIGVNCILLSLVLYLRSNVSGLGWYRTDSLLSVLNRSLMIVVCGILLWNPAWKGDFRIEWFVYAQTFTLVLTALVAFAVIFRELKNWVFRLRPVYLLLILKKSYPYALVIFLMTVYTRIDGVMIERLLADGTREAGIYAMAYRLLDAANMFGFLIAGLLLPMFARMLRDRQSVFPLLNLSFRIVWVVSIGLAFAVFFFRERIMTGLYVEGDAYSGDVLGYLILSFIAASGTYIHGTLLTANGSMLKMNLIFVIGVILNVLLNCWLIPEMQALGAALATCITQFVVWLAQVELVRRIFGKPLQWRLLGQFVLFAVACLLSFQWLAGLQGKWLWYFLLCFPLTGALAFVFGLVTRRQILELLSGRDNFGW
ncbi:oligosaccharide flippase family protein [Flavilitoribacter nigricans]|uniref:Polysaccharide biosynthesis protein n=1 Tax=Flavilitoribacter nigricans (strain ATCC 23147 / DSM 23189 / NBRC 102662 / NCIMB 1420 / SS-2) TaxID=1122177 RepID=A0A2D0N5E6_FLAN2|nr:oligosaccharide flippase family protein [Flavilitoribacter nigricans]PHN03606.1 polysaccharide biosynthesis protein [Flavilitoribacter nigricans DSM 23189 = NBRC 102662]